MRLSKKMEEQLEVIGKTYDVWFKIWRDTYFPRLIHQPIWFKTHFDLVVGDLVNFLKRDSAVGDAKWTMGMVEDINRGRDSNIPDIEKEL